MKLSAIAALLLAALALAGCNLRYALFGFPQPVARVAGAYPVELAYREARGGLVVLTGRVNGTADVDFILDTGAPVTVLLDGRHTAGLGLDSSRARSLGGGDNPAAPVGDIQDGFHLAFGGLTLSGLTAVVVPQKSMPCPEKFDEIGFGGVIGADLFRKFVVEIDTAAKRVRLHDPATWRAPEHSAPVALAFRNGHPFVEATVTLADGREVPAAMNVDIGMNRALTLVVGSHPAIVMPPAGIARHSCYVNGVRELREGGPVALSLGATRFAVEKPTYSDLPNAVDDSRTSTIGIGLFRGHRIVIDYPGRRLVVGRGAALPQAAPARTREAGFS